MQLHINAYIYFIAQGSLPNFTW